MESSTTNSVRINTNNTMRANGPCMSYLPTEYEVIAFYLKRKLMSIPLSGNIVPEVNVYEFDPWDLPGEPEEERYFFCTIEAMYPVGNLRVKRKTNSGFWKSRKEKQFVVIDEGDVIVGFEKFFIFYAGKYNDNAPTSWIMYEYRLADINPNTNDNDSVNANANTNASPNWVLCKIFKKREEAPDSSSSHSLEDACYHGVNPS